MMRGWCTGLDRERLQCATRHQSPIKSTRVMWANDNASTQCHTISLIKESKKIDFTVSNKVGYFYSAKQTAVNDTTSAPWKFTVFALFAGFHWCRESTEGPHRLKWKYLSRKQSSRINYFVENSNAPPSFYSWILCSYEHTYMYKRMTAARPAAIILWSINHPGTRSSEQIFLCTSTQSQPAIISTAIKRYIRLNPILLDQNIADVVIYVTSHN